MKTSFKSKSILTLFVFIICNFHSVAQQKIAYVEADSILSQMYEYQNIDLRLDFHSAIFKKILGNKQIEFQQYYESVVDTINRSLPTPEQYKKMIERVEKKQKELEQLTTQINAEIAKKEQELYNPVIEKFNKALAEVAKENGFDYIIDKKDILYINDGIDASDLVKVKLKIE